MFVHTQQLLLKQTLLEQTSWNDFYQMEQNYTGILWNSRPSMDQYPIMDQLWTNHWDIMDIYGPIMDLIMIPPAISIEKSWNAIQIDSVQKRIEST